MNWQTRAEFLSDAAEIEKLCGMSELFSFAASRTSHVSAEHSRSTTVKSLLDGTANFMLEHLADFEVQVKGIHAINRVLELSYLFVEDVADVTRRKLDPGLDWSAPVAAAVCAWREHASNPQLPADPILVIISLAWVNGGGGGEVTAAAAGAGVPSSFDGGQLRPELLPHVLIQVAREILLMRPEDARTAEYACNAIFLINDFVATADWSLLTSSRCDDLDKPISDVRNAHSQVGSTPQRTIMCLAHLACYPPRNPSLAISFALSTTRALFTPYLIFPPPPPPLQAKFAGSSVVQTGPGCAASGRWLHSGDCQRRSQSRDVLRGTRAVSCLRAPHGRRLRSRDVQRSGGALVLWGGAARCLPPLYERSARSPHNCALGLLCASGDSFLPTVCSCLLAGRPAGPTECCLPARWCSCAVDPIVDSWRQGKGKGKATDRAYEERADTNEGESWRPGSAAGGGCCANKPLSFTTSLLTITFFATGSSFFATTAPRTATQDACEHRQLDAALVPFIRPWQQQRRLSRAPPSTAADDSAVGADGADGAGADADAATAAAGKRRLPSLRRRDFTVEVPPPGAFIAILQGCAGFDAEAPPGAASAECLADSRGLGKVLFAVSEWQRRFAVISPPPWLAEAAIFPCDKAIGALRRREGRKTGRNTTASRRRKDDGQHGSGGIPLLLPASWWARARWWACAIARNPLHAAPILAGLLYHGNRRLIRWRIV